MGWLLASVVVALFSCFEPNAYGQGVGKGRSRNLLSSSDAEKVEQRVPFARDYPNAAKDRHRSYSDYDSLRITWGDPSHYEIGENIGHGTYANAYIGHVKGNRSHCVVVKHLKHATWYKIKREIAVMQAVHDGPFIVHLLDVIPHLHELCHRHPRMLTDDSSSSKSRRLLFVPHVPAHTSVPYLPALTEEPEKQGVLDFDGADMSGEGVDDGSAVSNSSDGVTNEAKLQVLEGFKTLEGDSQVAAGSDEGWGAMRRGLRSTAKEDPVSEKDLRDKVQALKDAKAISQYAYADPKRPASLVIEAVSFIPYESLVHMVTLGDVRRYTRQLVEALEYSHSRGIMHRDVKSSNTFINHDQKRLVLGDWGLAEFYFPKQSYKYSVCTRAYKAPELLLKYTFYNYAIDMWGVGMHVGSFVFRKKQIFGYAEDERGMLANIAGVLGTQGLEDLINKYSTRKPSPSVPQYRRRKWLDHFKLANPRLATPDALDFIDKLLRYDPEERLTASEALRHPFLRGVSV